MLSEDTQDVPDQNENDPVEEQAEEVAQTEQPEEQAEPEQEESSEVSQETPEERPAFMMPVSKAQEEKKRAIDKAREEVRSEAEAEIKALREKHVTELENSKAPTDIDRELERVASEHGLDKDAAKSLLDVFKKSVPVPDLSKYEQILKEQEIMGHKLKVEKAFDESVVDLIKKDYPNATQGQIEKVRKEVTQLAFTEGYNTYKVEDIYRVKQGDFALKSGYTAESSGGHSTDVGGITKLSDKEEHRLSQTDPAAFEKYIRHMASKDSKYID